MTSCTSDAGSLCDAKRTARCAPMNYADRTMSNQESTLQRRIHVALSRFARLFRNNVGVANYTTPDGRKQAVKYGLCPGSSDLIGWYPYEIKPEDVGCRVAVFVAVEVKTKRGRVSESQENFLGTVAADGGIAIIARDVDATKAAVKGWSPMEVE